MVEMTNRVSLNRWTWDQARASVAGALGRARFVTWSTAAVTSAACAGAGWVLTTGILRESAIIYGILAGVLVGYVARGAYIATAVRRAVAPIRSAIVPALVPAARSAQAAALVMHGGSLFRYDLLRVVRQDDAVVEIAKSDLTTQSFPRPGFFQLLMTGADGMYYDDGNGTMDQASRDADDDDIRADDDVSSS